MDYLRKTIFAYNSNPQKYIDQTMNMVPYDWVDKMENLLPPGGKILDAGCAYGRDANEFFERGFNAIGVDLSEELIKKGQEKFPKLAFKKMDVRKLDFPKDEFDAVWCNAVLLHLTDPDIDKALREFHRVLKKDGYLFVSIKEGEGSEEIIETSTVDEPVFFNYKMTGDIEEILRDEGFNIVEIARTSEKELYGTGKELYWINTIAQKAEKGGDIE